jgi:hypothetical protein
MMTDKAKWACPICVAGGSVLSLYVKDLCNQQRKLGGREPGIRS